MVYITTASATEARRIARAVVDEKLAACANILPGMTSVYRWKGKRVQGRECVLLLKSRKLLFKKLAARVKSLHSFKAYISALKRSRATLCFDLLNGVQYKGLPFWPALRASAAIVLGQQLMGKFRTCLP